MQSGLRGIAAPFGVANLRYKPKLIGGCSRPAPQKLGETVRTPASLTATVL
jgi:hypothetical protein